eukprot:222342_1
MVHLNIFIQRSFIAFKVMQKKHYAIKLRVSRKQMSENHSVHICADIGFVDGCIQNDNKLKKCEILKCFEVQIPEHETCVGRCDTGDEGSYCGGDCGWIPHRGYHTLRSFDRLRSTPLRLLETGDVITLKIDCGSRAKTIFSRECVSKAILFINDQEKGHCLMENGVWKLYVGLRYNHHQIEMLECD